MGGNGNVYTEEIECSNEILVKYTSLDFVAKMPHIIFRI